MISQEALDFYKKNKDLKWKMEDIPSNLTTAVEQASWILNKSNFGWIELDLEIDLGGWQLEAEQCKPFLVEHRENDSHGWRSCCIHGIDINKTGAWTNYGYTNESEVPYKWTSLAYRAPRVTSFWKHEFPADNFRRIRFMEVIGGGSINPHSDRPGRLPGEENFDALEFGVPINIAVIHPKECAMTLEGFGKIPFQEGKAFIINIRHYHSVVNLSKHTRIHVIGHSKGYGKKLENFCELVVRSYVKQQHNSI